MIYTAPIS